MKLRLRIFQIEQTDVGHVRFHGLNSIHFDQLLFFMRIHQNTFYDKMKVSYAEQRRYLCDIIAVFVA